MTTVTRTCKTTLHIALGALSLLALEGSLASDASAQARAHSEPVHEFEGTVIDGEADGPGAFYVLERARSTEQPREWRRSFVRRILESVGDEPF